MAAFIRVRDTEWLNDTVVLAEEFEEMDSRWPNVLNAGEGGIWSPSAPIRIAGDGGEDGDGYAMEVDKASFDVAKVSTKVIAHEFQYDGPSGIDPENALWRQEPLTPVQKDDGWTWYPTSGLMAGSLSVYDPIIFHIPIVENAYLEKIRVFMKGCLTDPPFELPEHYPIFKVFYADLETGIGSSPLVEIELTDEYFDNDLDTFCDAFHVDIREGSGATSPINGNVMRASYKRSYYLSIHGRGIGGLGLLGINTLWTPLTLAWV